MLGLDATSQVPPPEPDELGIVSEHMRGAIAQRMFGAVAAGSRIGRYEVRRVVGGGAMGAVFAAFDPTLGREVALKLLIGGSADDPSQPRRADRLAREAKALARLSHPNVVAVYEVGTDDDRVYIAMEYVEGVTLREWIDAHPVGRRGEQRAVVEMFQQAAAGLAAAHEVGLVHRDFKPDNALIGDDGRLRVADFGLAAWGRGAAKSDDAISGRDLEGARSSTSVGQVVGTPAYMAPEQIVGAEVGPAADQFALCVSLFEALFGRRPHTGRCVSSPSA
jgi:serine/threonine protein kinase